MAEHSDTDWLHLRLHRYRRTLAAMCECGHPRYDHSGILEPGCGHAGGHAHAGNGGCICLRFRAAATLPPDGTAPQDRRPRTHPT